MERGKSGSREPSSREGDGSAGPEEWEERTQCRMGPALQARCPWCFPPSTPPSLEEEDQLSLALVFSRARSVTSQRHPDSSLLCKAAHGESVRGFLLVHRSHSSAS